MTGMSPITFRILLALKDEPLDAEAIAARIREISGSAEPPVASFYRALKRALDEGQLQIAASAREDGRRGRPPQRYQITRSGKAALESEARRLGKLAKLALG